jgi:hypothetical protein
MARLHYVFILPSLALAACVTPSKSLGAGETGDTDSDPTSDDSSGSQSTPTTDDTDTASGNTLTTTTSDTDDPPVGDEWCSVYTDEESCNGAPEMENLQFCQWIELETMTVDAANDACTFEGPVSKCLTFDFDPSEGCGPVPCSLGPLVMHSAIARPVDEDTYEVWGLHDVFCGGGDPIGEWISADDTSLAQCAMTCGWDNPCAIPLYDYVMQRSDSSKDAPVFDCGWVTQDDSDADWQAAHDCVMDHMMSGTGFRVVADLAGIDSFPQEAYMGLQGESYAVTRFSADTGGIDPGSLYEQPAEGIGPIDDCIVGVGELCLSVYNAGEQVQLCPS